MEREYSVETLFVFHGAFFFPLSLLGDDGEMDV
jgi:hypothetical protein